MDNKHFPAEKMLALGFKWEGDEWRYKDHSLKRVSINGSELYQVTRQHKNGDISTTYCSVLDYSLECILNRYEEIYSKSDTYFAVGQFVIDCELRFKIYRIEQREITPDPEGEKLAKGYFEGAVPEGILWDKLEDLS